MEKRDAATMIDPNLLLILCLALSTFGLLVALRRARRDLRDSEAKFQTAIDSMQEGIVVRDRAGRIVAANRAGTEMLGLNLNQFAGDAPPDDGWRTIREDGTPLPREDWPSHVALRKGAAQLDQTLGVVLPWGETIWISLCAVPLFREGESEPYLVVTPFSDVTVRRRREDRTRRQLQRAEEATAALAEAYVRLSDEVHTDGLTRLWNHKAFKERLAEEVRRSRRQERPLSLALLDVDEFKAYNDRFGHPEGDEALRRVAALLASAARSTDVAARYGGEEFAVLLLGTDEDGAATIAERLRAAVEDADWPLRSITISVGVATLRPEDDPDGLVAEADAALYRAKRGGRNRVVHAGDEEGTRRLAA